MSVAAGAAGRAFSMLSAGLRIPGLEYCRGRQDGGHADLFSFQPNPIANSVSWSITAK